MTTRNLFLFLLYLYTTYISFALLSTNIPKLELYNVKTFKIKCMSVKLN